MGMKKAAYDAIVKKLEGTAAWERLSPMQKEARVKLDYKDTTDYAAQQAKEAQNFKTRVNKSLEAEANPTDPKNASFLKDQNMRDQQAIEGFKDSTGYKKGGKVKSMSSGGKTSQLAKANGCAVRGKSKGRIV